MASEFPPSYLEANISGRVIVATAIMLFITTVLLALRVYVRSLATAERGWDDYLLPPSWLFLIGLIVTIFIAIARAGVGRHVQAVLAEDPRKLETLAKIIYALDWFYVPTNALSRISVVLMYLRIFTNKWARFFCWVTFAFLVGNCLATIISAQVECTPLAYTWDKSIKGGKCFNVLVWWRMINIPNVVADAAIILLPIRTVWTLKASTGRKAGISLICLTGSVGMIASIVRTVQFFTLDLKGDATFYGATALTWTVVECGMYFSAACLVGLRPLYSKIPAWAKKRLGIQRSQSVYGKSGLVSNSRGAKSHFLRPKPGYDDLNSLTNIVTTEVNPELGEIQGNKHINHIRFEDRDDHKDGGQIRVQTMVEINSSKGEAAYSSYDFA